MALDATDLSVLAYANGFTLWHYTTIDNSITIANYFNGANNMLRTGDVIIANVDTDGTLSTKILAVGSINPTTGAVTLVDLLA